MIVLFQFIFLISKYLIATISKSLCESRDLPDCESISSEFDENSIFSYQEIGGDSMYLNGDLRFYPPAYIQRYETVNSILQQEPWKENLKKVVEFGCAELGFFLYLKHIPSLEEILEVDINENILNRNVFKAMPLNADYLLCKRPKPLNVFILCGSIEDYDDCLSGTDAVVAIELIEHLEPDVLKKVPWNVFHKIKPRIAIFTTPNADFNALFPNLVGFRHPDHKFEWTRREFYKWTLRITKTYPNYSVKLYGIGAAPRGSQNLGCCTQMAVFIRNDGIEYDKPDLELKTFNTYKLIDKFQHPFYVDKRTNEEKILDEVLYRVKFTLSDNDNYYNPEDEVMEIPLSQLMFYITEWCTSEEDLKKILLDCGLSVTEKNDGAVLIYDGVRNSTCGDDEEYSDDFDLSCENSKIPLTMENWDEEYHVHDKSPKENLNVSLGLGEEKADLGADEYLKKTSWELKRTMLRKIRKRKCHFLKTKNLSLPENLSASFPETNLLQDDLRRAFSESDIYYLSNAIK